MTSPVATAHPPRAFALAPRALVRLCSRAQRELWGVRLTRVYGIGIGLSYAVTLFWLSATPGVALKLWARALATASWVVGVGALSLARDLASRDTQQGLVSLARLRGYSDQGLERARAIAGALRLSGAVALPGLIVALAALLHFRTLAAAAVALGLALLTLPYAALLGTTLALLARLSSRLLPGRGRTVLLALVLGPWLLAKGTGSSLPSIPAAFGWLLERLAGSLS
ncbi:MAG TPA: hypothetical protein VIW29_13835 [Polyangiaceae bacterium]